MKGCMARKNYPYVGYGHRLLPGERLSCAMTRRQADSLLRADLKKRLVTFRRFGRDSLLLTVLSYNVGEYRLLGYGKQPKSRLVQKLESGDRDIRDEYTSFCRYRGKEWSWRCSMKSDWERVPMEPLPVIAIVTSQSSSRQTIQANAAAMQIHRIKKNSIRRAIRRVACTR